jgi:hypothetical protein
VTDGGRNRAVPPSDHVGYPRVSHRQGSFALQGNRLLLDLRPK